jgi:D-tyrosyl-tRNA(Tyr) deacylase
MRLVIQRVSQASVLVDGSAVSAIAEGLLVLVGIGRDDTEHDVKWASNKILSLRLWPNADGKPWQESIKSLGLEVLLVSQFTLFAVLKGNKPDYSHAMRPDPAKALFDNLIDQTGQQHAKSKIKSGIFGANMDVSLVNSGPVTITLDTDDFTIKGKPKKPVASTAKAPPVSKPKVVPENPVPALETLTFPSKEAAAGAKPSEDKQ